VAIPEFDDIIQHEAFAAAIAAIQAGRAPIAAEYRIAWERLQDELQAHCNTANVARQVKERRTIDSLVALHSAHTARLEITHVPQ